jgi:CDP-diacylglycerol pyrophosphatase
VSHRDERTWLEIEPLADGRVLVKGIIDNVTLDTNNNYDYDAWYARTHTETKMAFNITNTPYYINTESHQNRNTAQLRAAEFSLN